MSENSVSNIVEKSLNFDPLQADASYKPFPSFRDWSKATVDTGRWERYTTELNQLKNASPNMLKRALGVVELAAAVDTGALEGLYETDRGFTFSVAAQAAVWQTFVEEQKGPKVRALIESQLAAYDYVLDFATQQVPIAEAWIRTLHSEICRNQDTYTAHTEIGIQELSLPKGEYKNLPNHVMKKDGEIHSYAPVDLTSAEMHRLCNELRSDFFLQSHPILQSAYAHYGFVVIHPFADGNGRVARALASAYTYRSNSIPLLILAEHRREYLTSLESADSGDYQAFIDFILERGLDAIQLFSESLRVAAAPITDESLTSIKRLFVTKGGYSHTEVDKAGTQLMELFKQEMANQLGKIKVQNILGGSVSVESAPHTITNNAYRLLINAGGTRRLTLSLLTSAPASATVSRSFFLEIPRDCSSSDDFIIRNVQTNETFEVRASELIPTTTAILQMRIKMTAERIIREALEELSAKASQALRG